MSGFPRKYLYYLLCFILMFHHDTCKFESRKRKNQSMSVLVYKTEWQSKRMFFISKVNFKFKQESFYYFSCEIGISHRLPSPCDTEVHFQKYNTCEIRWQPGWGRNNSLTSLDHTVCTDPNLTLLQGKDGLFWYLMNLKTLLLASLPF